MAHLVSPFGQSHYQLKIVSPVQFGFKLFAANCLHYLLLIDRQFFHILLSFLDLGYQARARLSVPNVNDAGPGQFVVPTLASIVDQDPQEPEEKAKQRDNVAQKPANCLPKGYVLAI